MFLNAKALAVLALTSSAAVRVSAFEYGDADMAGHYFTYPHPTGNRIIDGSIKGTFPNNVEQIDLEMPADVTWAVGTHHPDYGFKFVVTTADNKAYCVHPPTQAGGPATMEEIQDTLIAGDQPPLVRHVDGRVPSIVTFPNVSPLSHPVPAGDGVYAFIDTAGDLVLWGMETDQEIGRLAGINALPDGRIVRSTNGHWRPWLALYAGAVEYDDGCTLGDCTEGTRLLVLKIHPQLGTIDTMADVQLEGEDVFEGMSPMFLPDDSVVATVANPTDGVSLRIYSPNDGSEISESDIAYGWRHQLFYNDFGTPANPLPYLVDLHGPHSDARKEMQFMSLSSQALSVDKTIGQYNTQPAETRYLDTNVSGDFNGDGIAEAIVPSRYRVRIASVQIDPSTGEPEEMWSLDMPNEEKMTSNLAVVASDAGIALAAASGDVFRMWMPPLSGASASPISASPTPRPSTSPISVPPTPRPSTSPVSVPPTQGPSASPISASPTRSPVLASQTTDATKSVDKMEGEMEDEYENLLTKVKNEEQDRARQQTALLATFFGVLVVATALLAFLVDKRRGVRKGLDSACTTPTNSDSPRDLRLDACTPDNSMDIGIGEGSDDEDDMEEIAIRLDRDVLIPEVI